MTVYVDEIQEYEPTKRNHGYTQWSHMWADDAAELHLMAKRMGLKREWFQDSDPYYPHYDVTPPKRAQAMRLGAAFKPAREHAKEVMKLKGLLK